ncbi:hypothetical protein ACWGLE_22020 [Streptomyces sp. NPDC055897]
MGMEVVAALAQEFSYVWNGAEEGWVLFGSRENPLIFNRNSRQALVIEDNKVNRFVVERMRESGAEYFSDPPQPQS